MAARRRSRRRPVVLVGGVAAGLGLGLLVAGALTGSDEPLPYRPFFAGMKADRVADIREGGPVLIPDPTGGERALYLDLAGDDIVALHVVPPGGTIGCPVQYDRGARRYTDCQGTPFDREALARFAVTTRVNDKEEVAVFVDLRQLLPAPGPGG